jgi:small-conductance mechanosensitive channel
VLLLLRALLAGKLKGLAQRSRTAFDDLLVDLLAGTRGWFLGMVILRFTALALTVPARWDRRFEVVLGVALALQGAVWASTLVRVIVDKRFVRHAEAGGPQVVPIAQTLVRFAGLVLVWTLAVLVILSNLGIDITALVAGLGIGGVAVALAVQRVLGDILASVSIAVDKPFQPGDFIVVGDQQGTVQRVGLRSTVLAGLGGEGLVLPNNDLLASRIRNFARMQERRVVFKVAIPDDTPVDLVEALPTLLRQCVEARDKVRFDRANLVNFTGAKFEYEIVYYMLSPDYKEYARVHEQLLLDVVRQARAAGYRLT